MDKESVTRIEYGSFQQAYDFFNAELFDGKLPSVLITFQRHANTRGYFAKDRFSERAGDSKVHELAMNPDTFIGRTDRDILSTLAHEMVHVWQEENKAAPCRGYHDKAWGAKMKEIGLYPSATGHAGGKETGQHMTHYIINGGAYHDAFVKLLGKGFKLRWESIAFSAKARKAGRSSKTKYTCPTCEQNAWAKPNASLYCGDCDVEMHPES